MFAIYILVLAFVIKYIASNEDIMKRIISAPLDLVVFGIVNCFFAMMLTGIVDVSCAKSFGVNIGIVASIGLTFIASAINLVLPLQLGSFVKAAYLKRKLSFSYSRYISIVSGTTILHLMITILQLISCLVITAFKWDIDLLIIGILVAVFCGVLVCFACLLVFKESVLKRIPFKRFLLPILEGFYMLAADKKVIIKVTITLLGRIALGSIRFYYIFSMLGFNGSFLDGSLYFGLYSASTVLPIIPGNVGISETIVGVMNSILGSDFEIGVTVVLINRLYYYVAAIIGALVASIPVWISYNRGDK